MLPGIASALISGAKPTSWGNDAFTKLLLHFDGTVGSTYFPDSSPQGHPAASVGGIAKVGAGGLLGSSGCLNAVGGGGLAVLPSTDWDFGSGDFTVDWFEYRADNTDNRVAVARDNTSTTYQAFLFGLAVTGNLFVYCSGDGASWNVVSGMSLGPIELSVWHHFAVVRKGTIFYGFRDGVLQTSQASALALAPSSGALAIGYWGSPGVYFNGYMEELRISKGIARWTANFTPPTAPYGPDTKVVLITAGSTWTVPADWTNTGNSIECIGGGAGAAGGTGSNSGGAGGAGGGYSKIADLTLTPGAVINLNVGVGSPGQTSRVNSSAGGDTWFNGASLAASSVGAKGGGGATTGANPGSVGGIGGAAASGVGTTKFSGGNGGNFGGVAGGGGGGSGGPHGNGANGASSGSSQGGGGGGGNGGGSAAAAVSSASGSNGGNNYLGAGAGVGGVIAATRNGTAGVNGGGGGGGFYDTAASLGGVGGSPAEWTATANGATAGPGGGGGGGAGNNGNGGNGGGFGAGGGAGGAFTAGATGGNGTNGIIVVTYKGAGP